jgi:hypothetical protein
MPLAKQVYQNKYHNHFGAVDTLGISNISAKLTGLQKL